MGVCGLGNHRRPAVTTQFIDTVACVRPDSLLTLHYRLADPAGRAWVDTFGHNPATLSLGVQQLAPALEQCLLGLEEGAQARFELPADAAFGPHDPQRVQRVPRSLLRQYLPDGVSLAVGDAVQLAGLSSASGASAAATVSAADDEVVELDFNHPLAGKAVVFDVQILGVL